MDLSSPNFYRARLYKRGICRRRVCVCVCVSVCVSVCLSHSGIVSKRLYVGSRKQRRNNEQCCKYGDKSNRWSLCLSLSRRSYWSQLAACGGDIFFKSTVAQTKMPHVSKTTPLLGVIFLLTTLNIVSLCRKFESSSFSHSWDMDGSPKTDNMSRDVTTPLSGTVCCPSTGTSYHQPMHQIWSLYLYSLRRYERRRKMQNWGGLGG